jgi:hypothetical protein
MIRALRSFTNNSMNKVPSWRRRAEPRKTALADAGGLIGGK